METTFKVIAWMEPRERKSYVPTYVEGLEINSIDKVDKGSEEAFATVQSAIMQRQPLREADMVDELRVWGYKVFHEGKTLVIRNHRISGWMREHLILRMRTVDGKATLACDGELDGKVQPEFCLVPSENYELYSVPLDPPFYVAGKEYRAIAANVKLPIMVLADEDYAKLGPL